LAVSFLDAARGGKERIKLPNGKTLNVTIPAGVKDGQQIRLRGQGGEGSGGGPAGDALVQITVKPHAFFERDGDNIRVTLPISLPEAVLGGKVEVPTVDGNVTMTVPKNANSGDKLRLKGKGLPQAGGKGRGDQLVTLQIRLPDGADEKLRDFVEEWAKQQSYNPRAGIKI
ncbi:MAG TPA: molecular chaperone DnaJ, partial [Alphaproteobacteria bacterium]|nr:molecular chaperone DnaJ [Alphaproteobacteria bacterium]